MDEQIDDELQPAEPELEPIPLDRLSKAALGSLEAARGIAAQLGDRYVGTEHLLLALAGCEVGAAYAVLDSLTLTRDRLERDMLFIRGAQDRVQADPVEPPESPRLQHVLREAAKDAGRRQHSAIGTLHLLSALMRERQGLAVYLLESPGVKLERTGLAISRAHREGVRDTE